MKKIQKLTLLIFFIFYSLAGNTQTTVKGIVKDLQTKEALGFCNVAIKGTKKGTITNIEGVFSISVNVKTDVLLFSYIGYEPKSVEASILLQKKEILLQKKELNKIKNLIKEKGYTIFPLEMFFNEKNIIKMEIGIGKGKKEYDKKKTIMEREILKFSLKFSQ